MLVQPPDAGPLLQDAGSGGRRLLLDPHLQHLLLLHALLLHGARLQAPPQGALQEARPPPLQRLARLARGTGPSLGEVQDAAAQATHGVHVLQDPVDPGLVAVEELQAQGPQVLQGLLRGREVATSQTLVGLRGTHKERV